MGITEKKIAHLKELAQAAPDNEWFYEKRKDGEYELSCLGIKFFKSEARRYIAAANPETVLAIIAEIERLKRTLDYQIRFMAEYKKSRGNSVGRRNSVAVAGTHIE